MSDNKKKENLEEITLKFDKERLKAITVLLIVFHTARKRRVSAVLRCY